MMAARDQVYLAPTSSGMLRADDTPRAGDARAATDDYRRKARHIRKLYADNPARLHHSLRQLSRRHDERTAAQTHSAVRSSLDVESPRVHRFTCLGTDGAYASARAGNSRAAVDWFADRIAAQLDRGPQILHYSQRLALLKDAARMGIGRFPANLMIATLQHERRGFPPAPREDAAAERQRPRLLIPTFVMVIQAAIIWAAWWVLHAR